METHESFFWERNSIEEASSKGRIWFFFFIMVAPGFFSLYYLKRGGNTGGCLEFQILFSSP